MMSPVVGTLIILFVVQLLCAGGGMEGGEGEGGGGRGREGGRERGREREGGRVNFTLVGVGPLGCMCHDHVMSVHVC